MFASVTCYWNKKYVSNKCSDLKSREIKICDIVIWKFSVFFFFISFFYFFTYYNFPLPILFSIRTQYQHPNVFLYVSRRKRWFFLFSNLTLKWMKWDENFEFKYIYFLILMMYLFYSVSLEICMYICICMLFLFFIFSV